MLGHFPRLDFVGAVGCTGWTHQLGPHMPVISAELFGPVPKEVVMREAEAIAPEIADARKAPFVPQRLVATMDRTLRICFRLTTALEAAYAGVPQLGKAF